MARTKEEETEWQRHRDELKALWLDQRWTLEQIQEHMSQRHSFRKSAPQYTRQFKKWRFKKNLTDEEWKFVAHRREKRKRNGKHPGEVRVHGNLIPEPKVRKETARHVSLLSQCLWMGDSDPKTPEGLSWVPRIDIDGTESGVSANVVAIDCSQSLSVDGINVGTSTRSQSTERDPLAFHVEFPELRYSQLSFQGNEAPSATPSYLESATLDHCPPVTSSRTPTSTNMSTHIRYDFDTISYAIAQQTRQTLLFQADPYSTSDSDDLISALEPITVGDVNRNLTRRAEAIADATVEAIFQSPSPENLSHCLSLFAYPSSNNLMNRLSADELVLLIKRAALTSAAAVGDIEICRILIEAGADLDAPSGPTGMRTTALHRATENNDAECARMLLEAGADPNLAVDWETPLHTACLMSEALDIVDLLLQFGAHVNPLQDCAEPTPLQLAVENRKPGLVQLLLDNKANPDSFITSKSGAPLQMACRDSANAEMVELLIAAGANIDFRTTYRCDNRNSDYLGDGDADSDSEYDSFYCIEGCICVPDSFKPAILIAAENENWEVVQLLLEEGAAINASLKKCPPELLDHELDKHDWGSANLAVFTPLQAVVREENITMTRMLLSAGAHIDERPEGKYGHTALQISAMVGNKRITEILLRKGADVNAPAGVYRGRTALQAAAIHSDTTVLSILLRHGADVYAPPALREGKTALQIAVAAGNSEGVRILLDANAAVNTDPICTGGATALQEAIQIRGSALRNEIVYLLLRAGANTEGLDYNQYDPLHAAVRNGDKAMTRKLLEKGTNANVGFCAQTGLTPVQQASSRGNEDLVQVLIGHGADVNGPPCRSGGRTALQAAVENGHVSTAKMLLEFGAEIKSHRAESHGISVMEAAAERCDKELVQLFLNKEPDGISSEPITKSQVIGLALARWKCDVPLLEMLLKGGAAVNNNPGTQSKPFLQIAVERHNYRVVHCLLSAGANVNHRWETSSPGNVTALQAAVSRRTIDIVQLLLEWGADVNAPANKHGGKTALQTAVSENHRVMTDLLVHHGADVNGLPSPVRGQTALQEAASSGYVQLSEYLLAHGAEVNSPAAHLGGVTALQGAAIRGNIRIVMMLLHAGADANGAPAIEQGLNAIDAAAENGRLDTLHLLLNYHLDTEELEVKRKRAAKLAQANGHLAIGRFLLAYRKHP
ncbi:Ankyrin repeat protein [Aspergillus fischeri NRRL 181]|uniref:Ankyrin repeat protein n=1 Tax=Neosartorya fischeri (strain ATCC 1020 / DSM 3700 / CBS 544.65 / FGSC A1164 / JCM 1740 / NRRL 181 / WB 181) TaxID=331117 RepID=A1CX58_NEOFI|nr:Ankyrin repeat protein [Aspergillus fischeri NRRL 181]EAW25210.1 Ankyrin repeat protein [Aspergillus fischeri NRRL 181]